MMGYRIEAMSLSGKDLDDLHDHWASLRRTLRDKITPLH